MANKNKKLNLIEILKDWNHLTPLYSPMFGGGWLDKVDLHDKLIRVKYNEKGHQFWEDFHADGSYSNGGECMIFPSKDNRDWSTFNPKVERFDPKALKPFDKVLVRDYDEDNWRIDIFSDICNGVRKDSIRCIGRTWYQCIPYNDNTKHLVGTTDKAPEYYKYWKD